MRRETLSEGWRIRYPFAKEAAMPVLPSAEFAMAKGERDAKRCAQGSRLGGGTRRYVSQLLVRSSLLILIFIQE